MYAIVRRAAYRADAVDGVRQHLDEFQEQHASQAGYVGTVVVDAGDGVWLTLNLWDSEEAARAALPAMIPVVRRLLEPAMREPSDIVGAGPVILTDLVAR